ncbi:TetR/AcrR family transcriptional regulator [Marinobacter mobilis]|uniref:Transcriptional regulator, TetR family n=1 Tax=Marinobacter mobilis TaxID=488533 RepID=A0A1H2QR38_9GAMM|nr:TetR/AcrR family transcriptional regulator [Marinobacter mobilis]SDW09673.1 transcriptional regulator, TetR family [Marinobacter mobilis]
MTDQLKTRREREKQARYEAILDAAEAVFSDKGYERTSMDDIARRASLSRALLYVYFRDKSAIQHGITLRAGANLRERMEKAAAIAGTGLEKAAAIGRAYYEFYREEPEYFHALTQANVTASDADETQVSQMHCSEAAIMELMVATIRRGLADGSLNRERIRDPMETALYLRGALHGVIMGCGKEIEGAFSAFPSEALIEHTMAMLMSSIASQS